MIQVVQSHWVTGAWATGNQKKTEMGGQLVGVFVHEAGWTLQFYLHSFCNFSVTCTPQTNQPKARRLPTATRQKRQPTIIGGGFLIRATRVGGSHGSNLLPGRSRGVGGKKKKKEKERKEGKRKKKIEKERKRKKKKEKERKRKKKKEKQRNKDL